MNSSSDVRSDSESANHSDLDRIDHIAISVDDIAVSVQWYQTMFRCAVVYADETWALLDFENIRLALVIPGQHPPHVAFASAAATRFGPLETHRDGTRSTYVSDPTGNSVELMTVK